MSNGIGMDIRVIVLRDNSDDADDADDESPFFIYNIPDCYGFIKDGHKQETAFGKDCDETSTTPTPTSKQRM